jgi:hypothetical protein
LILRLWRNQPDSMHSQTSVSVPAQFSLMLCHRAGEGVRAG